MSTRRVVGIILGLAGAVLSVGHIALALIANTAERYHGHEVVVGLGLVLAFVGILLLTDFNKRG